MSEQNFIEYANAGYRPLATDVWTPTKQLTSGDSENSAPSSYQQAIYTVEGSVRRLEDPVMRSLASRALMATVADQSARNNHAYISDEVREKYAAEIAGNALPDAMIKMLHEQPVFGAVEIARKTHVAQWGVQSVIDTPVRNSLDFGDIDTLHQKSDPRYKIKVFDDLGVMVERKRIIRTHYNGEIMTIIRNCLLLDYTSDGMPLKLKRKMRAKSKAIDDRNKKDFDFSDESEVLRDALEVHISVRGESSGTLQRPKWAVPLLTTYYGTRADKLKTIPTLTTGADSV